MITLLLRVCAKKFKLRVNTLNQLTTDKGQAVELVLTWSKTFGLMLLIANGLIFGCLAPMSIILWYYSKILKHIRISEQRVPCTTQRGKTRHMRHILYYTTAFITFGLPFWLTKRLLLAFKVKCSKFYILISSFEPSYQALGCFNPQLAEGAFMISHAISLVDFILGDSLLALIVTL